MKIKIYRCNVKANINDDLQKVKDYFKSHNLDVTFDVEETQVKLPEWNVRSQLVLPLDGKYDIVAYLYDRIEQNPGGTGKAENFSSKTASIFLPTGILEDPIGFHFYALAHEVMHCLFYKVRNTGVLINDPMDTYVENTNPYSTTGNFAQAFKNLQPYWNLLQPQTLPIENYFKTQEFVPHAIYQQFGEKSIWFIDPRLQKLANFTRKFFGKPVTINNWMSGGNLDQRGFRDADVGAKNGQHRFGRAIDINVAGMTPKAVSEAILANQKAFMDAGLTCMEDIADTPTWNHLDIRQTGLNTILIVKP